MPTLLRALIDATGLSRRKAFAAIREGRVSLDGDVVDEPSLGFETGRIALDGFAVDAPPPAKTYVLLNKPPGYVTTRADEQGRATVFDLLPQSLRAAGLHPIGRLDKDTSGLLLLTDDGDLTYRLTHPKHEIEKEYWLRLGGTTSEAQLAAIRRGIELDGALHRPVRLERLNNMGPYQILITLLEGRKREVRRLFEAVGSRVRLLRRVREGPLRLTGLAEGDARRLTPREVALLKGETGDTSA